MEERGAVQADLDERRLHPRHHPLHIALVDVADHAARPAALDVQLLQHPVLDHRDAGFARGDVDQDFLAHAGIPPVASRSSRAVSCKGRPITPEWLPDRCAMNACALPWIAYAPAFRSEEHTSELQSLMRISSAVFCL